MNNKVPAGRGAITIVILCGVVIGSIIGIITIIEFGSDAVAPVLIILIAPPAVFIMGDHLRFRGGGRKEREERFISTINRAIEVTPEELFALRKNSEGSQKLNFLGVYIIINQTKNKCYVGQSAKILNGVHSHFTGRGNSLIYADFRNGDKFIIKLIDYENSEYLSIEYLKRKCIDRFRAYPKGYNMKR